MASNSEEQAEMYVDLTSPLSSVDVSSKDRGTIQEELEKRLKNRADREELVEKNILPDLTTSPKLFIQTQQLQRAKIADNLQKKLRNRADRTDLRQMNILPILPNIDPALHAKQLQLKKSKLADQLNEKLAKRPGPLELIQEHILEPRNEELAAVLGSVTFEKTSTVPVKFQRPSIPEISLQGSEAVNGMTVPAHRHSIAGTIPTTSQSMQRVDTSPPKDIASPLSDTSVSLGGRKFSDSSLSPNSPGDAYDEVKSPEKSPQNLVSPRFTSSYPPCTSLPPKATQTPGILSGGGLGKAPSPSQTRKKQQKQQKYRKLRYHEYVPPSRPNAKPGKTTPKPSSKPDTPYSLLLQQQQLFLQLQVLQQQYPNGVLMQKLPDLLNTMSTKKGKNKGRSSVTSPTNMEGTKQVAAVVPAVPQVLQVEQPNRFNSSSVRFDELKVSDLKAACKEMGMIVSGKKAELVERLLEHNNGVLPVAALPDNQSKDTRRHTFSTGNTSSMESQVSTFSPASPSLSPIFQFPSDQYPSKYQHQYQHHQQQQQQTLWNTSATKTPLNPPPPPPPMKQDSLPNTSPLSAPQAQVFPASNFQAQFNELYEKQKRDYISQRAPMSLAPRPELNDMVAIKFSRPMDQQQSQRMSRGSTLPGHGEGKPNFLQMEKQSQSLPSSPRPLSPAENLLEIMDDTSGLTNAENSFPGVGPLPGPSTSESLYLVPNSVPLSVAATSAATIANSTTSMSLPTTVYNTVMRPTRSSVPIQPKVHPMNPPSYGSPMMQRSISLSGPPPMHPAMGSIHPMHSGNSFSSDMSDLVTPPEVGKAENMMSMAGEDLIEAPMETAEYKESHDQLSEIFDILRADGNADFVPPPQPHSLGSMHYAIPTKLAGRQDSTQSDSVMLMPFSNPSLALHHKSGSDLNLPGHESHKNSSMYVGSGVGGAPSELGWLDLDSSNMLSLSPTLNMFGGMGQHSSNPGSLPHEQFHLGFLDSGVHSKCSNPSLNGLSSQGHEVPSYLDPGNTQHSELYPPTDDAALIMELGLSTS